MTPLPLASTDDARLDREVSASLKALRIPSDWAPTIRRLATGETPASSLRCCGSGCRPCVMDLQRCTVRVLTQLQSPDAPEPASRTGLRLRARSRSILRKLKGDS